VDLVATIVQGDMPQVPAPLAANSSLWPIAAGEVWYGWRACAPSLRALRWAPS
jgi:hypothetical protein